MTINDLVVFMLVSQIVIAAYLLYNFIVTEREGRKRTAAVMAHIDKVIADLERRLATGTLRGTTDAERAARVPADTAPAAQTGEAIRSRDAPVRPV